MTWIRTPSQNILVAEFPIIVIFATWLTMEMALIKYFIHNNWLKASSVSFNVSLSNLYVHIIYLSFKCTTAHVQILESAYKWQHNFQGVLMSGSFFQRVSAIVCQGTFLACCVLKSLNQNTQHQSWSPMDLGFVVKPEISVWWRSLMWRGEILAAGWADAPEQPLAGAQAKSSIVQGDQKQMKGCLWHLMTVVTGAAYPVNSLLFFSLMLLTECVTHSWWNRDPGSALWSSFIAFLLPVAYCLLTH